MTVHPSNGSYSHLIDQIDSRLDRIEKTLDRLVDHHEERHERIVIRISDLEKSHERVKGGWTVLTILGTIAGAVGGVAAKWLG